MRTGLLLIIPLSLLLMAGCSHKAPKMAAFSASLAAAVVPVTFMDSPRTIEVQGMIHADDDATLSSRAMGPIVREYVKLGDKVSKGQPLMEIEERMSAGQLSQAKGALAQAKAAYAVAERNHRRFQSLYEKKACSELELDLARMQFEQASGAVEQAEGAVATAGSVADESVVRAPFDAVVVEKMASVGDLVAPGRPLVRVQSTEGRELYLSARAADARYFKRGDTLEVVIEAHPELDALHAIVTEVSPSGDMGTQTFTVKAAISDRNVPAGVGATAFARGEQRPTLLIPESAVYATGGLDLVSVVDSGNIARTRAVTLGRAWNGRIEVLSGLEPTDRVVTGRQGPIVEGTRITGTRP